MAGCEPKGCVCVPTAGCGDGARRGEKQVLVRIAKGGTGTGQVFLVPFLRKAFLLMKHSKRLPEMASWVIAPSSLLSSGGSILYSTNFFHSARQTDARPCIFCSLHTDLLSLKNHRKKGNMGRYLGVGCNGERGRIKQNKRDSFISSAIHPPSSSPSRKPHYSIPSSHWPLNVIAVD